MACKSKELLVGYENFLVVHGCGIYKGRVIKYVREGVEGYGWYEQILRRRRERGGTKKIGAEGAKGEI